MTLGNMIQQKRTLQKMTRHQLAEKMQTSDVTLYRLENNSRVRLTQEMVEQLRLLLDPSEIQSLPEGTEWEKELKNLLLGEENKLTLGSKFALSKELESQFLCGVREQLAPLGYQCSLYEGTSFNCYAVNEASGKRWGIILRIPHSRPSSSFSFMDIGTALCYSDFVQKVSIAYLGDIPESVLNFVLKYKSGLLNCPIDLSILSINPITMHIDREEEIVLKRDGKGLYPFDKDENTAYLEYGRWKMSLV